VCAASLESKEMYARPFHPSPELVTRIPDIGINANKRLNLSSNENVISSGLFFYAQRVYPRCTLLTRS